MLLTKLVIKLLNQSYLNPQTLARSKRQWAKTHGFMPGNSQILLAYKKLVSESKIRPNRELEHFLRLKKVRSLSGIVPVALMTKPYPCPGQCIYCPTQAKIPKSYLDDEPAVMRARRANFDPYLQVKRRLKQLRQTGHSTQKIELIIMGGTFSVLPHDYQLEFIIQCFAACNKSRIKNDELRIMNVKEKLKILVQQQKINEEAKQRIIGLTLETRPDFINEKEIKWLRILGCTRVEIGVQSLDDAVLKKVKRGHGVSATVKATRFLKDAGFKVCYHLMPNLPGSNPTKDLKMLKNVFTNPRFKPDMLKIYPCVVLYQAKLYKNFKKGQFKPYTDTQLIKLLLKIKKIVPEWVRINRLGRDIPVANIAAGNKLSNIRQILQTEMKKKKLRCRCIRCREIKNLTRHSKHPTCHPELDSGSIKIIHYQASGGIEYFLQYCDQKDRLLSLLRLRFPGPKQVLSVLKNSAIIRELHTYGLSLPLKNHDKKATQHEGLGKKLLVEAEKIAQKQGYKKIAVISGIGARDYYRKLGYQLKDTYMVKDLDPLNN